MMIVVSVRRVVLLRIVGVPRAVVVVGLMIVVSVRHVGLPRTVDVPRALVVGVSMIVVSVPRAIVVDPRALVGAVGVLRIVVSVRRVGLLRIVDVPRALAVARQDVVVRDRTLLPTAVTAAIRVTPETLAQAHPAKRPVGGARTASLTQRFRMMSTALSWTVSSPKNCGVFLRMCRSQLHATS